MGLVNSHLKKKKKKLIKEIDILNNEIFNLQLLNTDTSKKCGYLINNKNYLDKEIQQGAIAYKNLEIKIKNLNNCITNFECKICMERPIDSINIPCGHTFCCVCINSCVECYICRKKIDNKIKLFID